MASAVVAVTGVLRDDQKRVIPEGRRLLAALGEHYRVVLVLDDAEIETFNVWARMEHITGHQEVLAADVPAALRGYDERIAQVEYLRGRGEHVVLVVDPNPTRIAEVMKHGLLGLLFCDPGLQRPEYRPDYEAKVKPWDDIVAEIEAAHYQKTVGD